MAAPAEVHGGAGGGAGDAAAAAAANIATFNDASSFRKLTDGRYLQLPRKDQIDIYTIEDDEFPVDENTNNPSPEPEFLDRLKRELLSMPELNSLKIEDIDYNPVTKTLYSDKVSMPICMLPEGSIIHRFDKEGAVDPSKNVPIFFGNKTSVSFYSGKKSAGEINTTRSSYRIKRAARLLHMNTESLSTFIQLQLTPEEEEFFQDYSRLGTVRNSANEPVEIPILLPATPYGTLAEIKSQAREKTFNRRFAEIVCRLGFDGWVIKPLDPDTQEGVLQITGGIHQLRSPDGTIVTPDTLATLSREQGIAARFIAPLRGNVSPMPPEIVICRWDIFMDRIAGGGGSRRRRRRLSHRQRSTKHQSRRR